MPHETSRGCFGVLTTWQRAPPRVSIPREQGESGSVLYGLASEVINHHSNRTLMTTQNNPVSVGRSVTRQDWRQARVTGESLEAGYHDLEIGIQVKER